MIVAKVDGLERLARKLNFCKEPRRTWVLKEGISQSADILVNFIKYKELSDQVLKVKTGRLRNSINKILTRNHISVENTSPPS